MLQPMTDESRLSGSRSEYGVREMKSSKDFTEELRIQPNERRLEHLMDQYGEQLIRLAYTYVKDWGKAEDIVQDVFLTCYLKLDSFRHESSYKTWLYRITINRCKDNFKRWSFKNIFYYASLSDKRHPVEESPESVFLNKINKEEIESLIFTLPIIYREMIILFYYEEMSLRQISQLLDVKSSTLKSRLSRARELLKKKQDTGRGPE
ncbi:sigma-70 family RNA polymerase sigma factor [Alkalihalobacillus deserti]|uniref:sigma-70 family RNA polymerase sigma factor n=1 Tax=Alkalihalobacillus deserti TaxID=2879466 RepID=UPI001D14CCCE|nr:sigma-70 family RNA polymerase sigma factor [Alkalihalobacillus deserti]